MIALFPWRWQVRYLAWLGHSVPHIAMWIGRPMNDVERLLFPRGAA